MFSVGFNNILDGLLDAQINHPIAVIGQDDIHQVFTNIVNVAFHRGDNKRSLGTILRFIFFHIGFEISHRCFHRLRRLQHERQLHLPGTEQFAHHFHAIEEEDIDNI